MDFGNAKGLAIYLGFVEPVDRCVSCVVVFHFHEAKAARPAVLSIGDQASRVDRAIRAEKENNLLFSGVR